MSFGSRDLRARSPQNAPYTNVADESASVSIRSGKGLPLSRVNNSWPLGPAMLPYPRGGSFSWDHRPWLQAVDEFASKSLTSHQRTNRRWQHQLDSMSVSQEGRTPGSKHS